MTEKRAKRKLSGILSADAVGYSRLMQEDEASTIRNLENSKNLMGKLIERFKGRVVDAPGDNLLAEFSSVVDATECAVQIQQELKTKNVELLDDRKMQFRIGVNLGDVVEEADRIYGDGVNIAARLEGLAEPGGICISRTAYDHVKNKLKIGYEYLGEHHVKNIAEPVRVYRVLMAPEAAGKVIGEKRFIGRISRRTAVAAIILLVIVAGALIGWNIYLHQSKKVEPASVDQMALPLPDRPSIAVLPFNNMSSDPEQEFFCDGITDEIITALAKIPDLFVIARNSTFVYKGKPVKIKQVSEELGVHYVLEGGVQRAGDQIRINVQLIDAIKGYHTWAERYDGKMVDIFELQDRFTQKIIAALAVKLTPEKEQRVADRGTKNIEAYDAYLQGRGHLRPQTSENLGKVVAYLKKAVDLDPDFTRAHASLAGAYSVILTRGYGKDLGISDVRSLLKKHLKLAFKNPTSKAHRVAAWANIWNGRIDEALEQAERGFALEPNNDHCYLTMGGALIYAGRSREAIPFLEKAMRINPDYPAMYLFWLGVAQFCEEEMTRAAATFERARSRNPHLAPYFQIAAYEYIGRGEENPDIIAGYIKIRGWKEKPSIKGIMQWYQFKNPKDRELLINGLQKAELK
jgi:TolB-like protein/class 3 adenylate cyclase